MGLNALNLVYNLNSNNTTIFNTCGFHHCSFCEQNVIILSLHTC